MALSQIQIALGVHSQEYLLLDYVAARPEMLMAEWRIHIHLSEAEAARIQQDHHIRIAAATVQGMVRTTRADLHPQLNSDLFLICKDAAIEDIDAAIMSRLCSARTRYPRAMTEDLARFCTWYNVTTQHRELLDLVSRCTGSAGAGTVWRLRGSRRYADPQRQKSLDPGQLGKLSRS